MQRYLLVVLLPLLLLACAGNKPDATAPGLEPVDRGRLVPIASESVELTVQTGINVMLFRASLQVPMTGDMRGEELYFLLNHNAFITSMQLNGHQLTPEQIPVIKPKYFAANLTDSQWDRIAQFASLYRVKMPDVVHTEPLSLAVQYNIRATEAMTWCQLEDDEFVLDGIGFWYPSNLENDYPFHIEVTHPAKFFVELLDNRVPSEEVTPTMRLSSFDVAGQTEPLLLMGMVE